MPPELMIFIYEFKKLGIEYADRQTLDFSVLIRKAGKATRQKGENNITSIGLPIDYHM